MIGLVFNSLFRPTIGIPCALISGIAAVLAVCGCVRCAQWRLRDCPCIKRLLLWSGHDEYDDFELVIVTHQLFFERSPKLELAVRVSAGSYHVMSDYSKKCIFQQPLVLFVEQGTQRVTIDIVDKGKRVLATLSLAVVDMILRPAKPLRPEMVYRFKPKSKLVSEPRAQLTIHVNTENDVEHGLLEGLGSETDILVRQHLLKARNHVGEQDDAEMSQIEVLKESCAGPLERMFGLGNYETIYASVVGPPTSRNWILGFWRSKEAFVEGKRSNDQIDLLKVLSVQADPSRLHVFTLNYLDDKKNQISMVFRRLDRNRNVWVECLQRLIQQAHTWKKNEKNARQKTPKSIRN
jgi:hypothetical protein